MSERMRTTQTCGLARPSDSRQLPVRLIDIRPEVRLKAARQVAVDEPGFANDALHAALWPSPTVYWINETALPTLLKVAA